MTAKPHSALGFTRATSRGAPTGLELGDDEEFIVRIRPSLFLPPIVEVDHTRFLGYPHVLQGQRLCIYLDPSREWCPSHGIAGFLSRLWDWLTDAAGGAFDASTAMYHAVGGVLHQADGTPTIVVREPGPCEAASDRSPCRTFTASLRPHLLQRPRRTPHTRLYARYRPPLRSGIKLRRCSSRFWTIRTSTAPKTASPAGIFRSRQRSSHPSLPAPCETQTTASSTSCSPCPTPQADRTISLAVDSPQQQLTHSGTLPNAGHGGQHRFRDDQR